MKKLIIALVILMSFTDVSRCFAVDLHKRENFTEMRFILGSNICYVNGKEKQIDEDEDIISYVDSSGNVMIPLRFFAESMGAEVLWNEKEPDAVILQKNGHKLCILPEMNDSIITERNGQKVNRFAERENWTGQYIYESRTNKVSDELDGTAIPVAVKAEKIKDRIFVLADAAELFGFTIDWLREEKTLWLKEIPDSELWKNTVDISCQNGEMTVETRRETDKFSAYYLEELRYYGGRAFRFWVTDKKSGEDVFYYPGPGPALSPSHKYIERKIDKGAPMTFSFSSNQNPNSSFIGKGEYVFNMSAEREDILIFYFRDVTYTYPEYNTAVIVN